MDTLDVEKPRKVPWLVAAAVSVLLTLGMVYLRFTLYPHRIVPLTYALPLLVALWHRDRVLLWGMAACFLIVAGVKDIWFIPDGYFDGYAQQFIFTGMQWLNTLVPAGVIHLVLSYQDRQAQSSEALAAANGELETSNEELMASNEELAVREEEISRQNEELQAQAEELEQQAEELRTQAEELQTLNEELAGREGTLQMLLQLSGPTTDESQLLDQLCAAGPKLLGEDVAALAVLERRDGGLIVRAHSEFGSMAEGEQLPMGATLAALAMERSQVAQLEDTRLRPDLRFPKSPSGISPASIMSAPLFLGGQPVGALEAYASTSRAWTPQQAQLVDWLAGQCSRAWEHVRLREERKRAEEMLAESEKRRKVAEAVQAERERFNRVLDMLPAYVVLLSPDYHVPFANRFFEERFGKSEGRRCYEYLFQRTEPCENCETYTVLKTGEPHRWEWTGPDSRNYDIYDFPFTDVDGSPLIMEVGLDITERRRAEAAIREANERLEQRVAERTAALRRSAQFPEENPNPVLRIAADGTLLFANAPAQAWLAAFSTTAEQPLPAAVRAVVTDAYQQGPPLQTEVPDPTGHTFWISAVRPPGEEYVNIYGRDITARKAAEEALRRTADELARSNKDLEQFAYVASHDLQEPLRMVAGYLQLLSERYRGWLDEKADKFIDYAVDGAERMSGLIRDLLGYSRVNTRGEQMQKTSADEALDLALRNLRAATEESGAAISRDPLPDVWADKSQLVQVFQNLLGNAIKFRAPDRSSQIHVSIEKQDEHWVFAVRDNGIGFDEKYRDKMFLIFQRLHSRGKYPGTGIGLALCKRIVERHGGKIWATGTPGEGATFYFTIPMRGNP